MRNAFGLSRYDGTEKYLTKDCDGCPYYVHGRGAERLLARFRIPRPYRALAWQERRFCIWGVALKTLVEPDRSRWACAHREAAPPGAEEWLRLLAAPIGDPQKSLPIAGAG